MDDTRLPTAPPTWKLNFSQEPKAQRYRGRQARTINLIDTSMDELQMRRGKVWSGGSWRSWGPTSSAAIDQIAKLVDTCDKTTDELVDALGGMTIKPKLGQAVRRYRDADTGSTPRPAEAKSPWDPRQGSI